MKLYKLLLLFVSSLTMAQTSISVLTHKDYLSNPVKYLSKLDSAKVQTGVLIDRSNASELIMNVNGKSKVTTIDPVQWAQIYDHLKNASYDKSLFSSFEMLNEARDLVYQSQEKTYPIAIVDYHFNKINQSALDNGTLKEENEYLIDNSMQSSSFSEERVFAVSTLHHMVSGDNVQYYIDDFFRFSNNKKQVIEKMEIDFGNGEGFREVFSKETISVQYHNTSTYINMVAKFTFKDTKTEKTEVLHSHFTILRKSLGKYIGNSRARINNENQSAINPSAHYHDFFPEKYFVTKEIMDRGEIIQKDVLDDTQTFIEYFVIYSDPTKSQTASPLRKPFIICDGFDPGNRRSYDEYVPAVSPNDMLDNEKDFRGLYELINGDPSSWSSETTSANLIKELTDNGYDLVIVNYIKGAGDVIENGKHFKDFLTQVINGPKFRDSKTEEAVLVGPSMGGLITRYALSTMEKEGQNHYVKTWISFDSPQQGAYIPLALQHTVKTFSHITSHGTESLEEAKKSFERSKSAVNTTAARQLLLCHYSESEITGDDDEKTGIIHADPQHKTLYKEINDLPYPKFSENYAITNGGKSKLYENDGVSIINFQAIQKVEVVGEEITDIEILSASGSALSDEVMEFKTNRVLTKQHVNFEASLPYENAPGGFHTGLYSLNYNNDNNLKPDQLLDPLTKATFISTSSAFGMPVTTETIHKTHDEYTADETPFDVIYGMEENQEHVEISTSTRDYLLKELEEGYNAIKLPFSRQDENNLKQLINGDVAYNAKTIVLGDNGNTFQIQDTAEVNISAKKYIEFLPGFEIQKGADVNAEIDPNKTSKTVLRKQKHQDNSIDYTKKSPYRGLVYDYSEEENEPELLIQELDATIYPNPFDDYFSIELSAENTIITSMTMNI